MFGHRRTSAFTRLSICDAVDFTAIKQILIEDRIGPGPQVHGRPQHRLSFSADDPDSGSAGLTKRQISFCTGVVKPFAQDLHILCPICAAA